jgi:hypothetical protein
MIDDVFHAKRKADFFFFYSFTKNCKLGPNRCSHPGCPEAKLMHLHLKVSWIQFRFDSFCDNPGILQIIQFLFQTRLVTQSLVQYVQPPIKAVSMPEN